jgi:8-oxo-dGTP pyrophosphatase MutT (NUDIX family)
VSRRSGIIAAVAERTYIRLAADLAPQKNGEPRLADTIRCILVHNGRVLFLQKEGNSKNRNKWELPGGKIDGVAFGTSSLAQQHTALRTEVSEETNIDIEKIALGEPIRSFAYSYSVDGTFHARNVHQFVVRLQDSTKGYEVIINKTRRTDGSLEDNHINYKWVDAIEYEKMKKNNEIAKSSTVLGIL